MLHPEELGLIRDAARLAGVLPELQNIISKMERQAEQKVFDLLSQGKLTPEMALYAWQEKQIMRRFLTRFDQKVRSGQSLAAEHHTELE
jgi:hypothetical protein